MTEGEAGSVSDLNVTEAQVEQQGTEVVVTHSPNLFHADTPAGVVDQAAQVATKLAEVLKSGGMIQNISGKEYVKVEGWQTLGSMLGVSAVGIDETQIEGGWKARAEARTLDGVVIGAAAGICTREERMWSKRDEYALLGMAQTRAISRALRGPLGFVVKMAGYEATAAEEIPTATSETPAQPVSEPLVTADQVKQMQAAFGQTGKPIEAWRELIAKYGCKTGGELPAAKFDEVMNAIKALTITEDDIPF